MLGAVDHVGYLVADLDAAVARFIELFGLTIVRPVDLPQFSVLGQFLGDGDRSGGVAGVELFTFTDAALLAGRLGGGEMLVDHAAHEVRDIESAMRSWGSRGVRFAGPDRRTEVEEPFVLGGVRHVWTVPQSSLDVALQLIQR